MTEDRHRYESSELIVHAQGPPDNQVPAVLDVGALWTAEGAAVAVPYLLVYTTGVQLSILGRARHIVLNSHERARTIGQGLEGHDIPQGPRFRVSGSAAMLLGGEHEEHAFNYRAWVVLPKDDMILSLAWPEAGIAHAEHVVARQGIQEAADRVLVLWP
jgi:hypothetical protein